MGPYARASETATMARLCHDVRQYVAAGLMVTRMPGDEDLPPPVRQRLQTVELLLAHVSEMVGGNLDHEDNDQVTRSVDLTSLVDECIQVFGLPHDVPIEVDECGPAFGRGDPVLLRRAIGNVLDNALRAAGDRGTVHVRVGSDEHSASVEVRDDGTGFGTIASGTGHGMSVVGSVLRECHGRLEITSGPGPGTTVRMAIPSGGHERTRAPARRHGEEAAS